MRKRNAFCDIRDARRTFKHAVSERDAGRASKASEDVRHLPSGKERGPAQPLPHKPTTVADRKAWLREREAREAAAKAEMRAIYAARQERKAREAAESAAINRMLADQAALLLKRK